MDKFRLIAQLKKEMKRYRDIDHIRLGIIRMVELAWDHAEEAEG